MKTRWLIALAALLAASCKTNGRNSALTVSKVVLGTISGTTCTFDASADEFNFAHIDPAANTGGTLGVVLQNNLKDPSSINTLFNTNSATFHPHQVVADYEVIGGTTLAGQIIPVSGGQVAAGGSAAVLVPFFSPAATATLTGEIRVTFHVEGKLDDGSVLKSSEHEYIFVTCSTAGCNSDCL